jgi:hypothetical protein
MLKSNSKKQANAQTPGDGQGQRVGRKPMSDGKIKTICLTIFLLVAAGGLYINLSKFGGASYFKLFGISAIEGEGGLSKEDRRKEIMNSDMSDTIKALKLQQLSNQE